MSSKKQKMSLSDLSTLVVVEPEPELVTEIVEEKVYITRPKKDGRRKIVAVSAVNNNLFFDYAAEFDQFQIDQCEVKSVNRYGKWLDIYSPKSGKYPDGKPYNDVWDVYKISHTKLEKYIVTERCDTFQNEEKHNVSCDTYHTSWTQTETIKISPRCNLPEEYFNFLLNGGKIKYE